MTSKNIVRFWVLIFCVVALILLGITETSRAAAPSAEKPAEIVTAGMTCQSDDVSRLACRDFIAGFLKGALLTDTAIVESLRPEPKRSSIKDRALRTRIGGRVEPPTKLAGFCLPANRSFDSIVDETLLHVANSTLEPIVLGNAVYASLKKDYTCA